MADEQLPDGSATPSMDFKAALSKVVASGSKFKAFLRAFMQTVASALSASPDRSNRYVSVATQRLMHRL